MKKTTFAVSAVLATNLVSAEKAPWTCFELQQATDSFYRMFPAYLGRAKIDDDQSQVLKGMQGHCFLDIGVMTSFEMTEEDELAAKIVLDLDSVLGLCAENLQISTAFSDYYTFYMLPGHKEIKLTFTDSWEIADIQQNGLRFFTYCSDPFEFLESSVTTAFMWVGGNGLSNYLPAFGEKPTVFQTEKNSLFLEQFGGVTFHERIINYVEVPQQYMQTGDVLIGRRLDGDSAAWMLLDGGFANHAAMIVEDGNSYLKYVIDCPADLGVLQGFGSVRKTELNEWLNSMLAQDYEVVWLPLDKNLRTFGDLDEENLLSWFETVVGSPYDSVQRFFAAVDTSDESFPAPFNAESFPINLRLFNQFKGSVPDFSGKKLMDVFQDAINKRIASLFSETELALWTLPTDVESTIQFANEHLDLSLNDLIAIPEDENWRYAAFDNRRTFTPGSFVAAALNELGVFHGAEINSTEFTVKDVYQLDIYDLDNFQKPYLCIEADFSLDYCQLFGANRLELPGYSTVQPYAHMNERCPNSFENTLRPPKC